MEYPPSPTISEPSRRGSLVPPALSQAIASHPKSIQARRPSRFSLDTRPSEQQHLNSQHRNVSGSKPHEQSPLLAAQTVESREASPFGSALPSPQASSGVGAPWNAEMRAAAPESKSSWYLILLTISLGGLQLAWAVELSGGSPYLLSLGLSKSLLALVWIAGPLSGVLVQPYVGIKSDQCRSRFGRRRPFILGGAIATVASLMFLAWTREFIGALLGAFGASREGDAVKTTSIVFAVIMVYVLDFSVNVIQAGIRAFIVDNAPLHQQDTANAWANRMSNVGNIILYVFGYIDLPRHLWFFGNTQFKVLCVIASVGLLITVLVSCSSIKEKSYRQSAGSKPAKGGILVFFRTLFHSVRYLPRQIKRVCQVQLAAWIGWFPFLFYGSTYIGEIYVDPIFRENPNMTPAEVDAVWEQGTRVGTFALLIFAVTSLVASIVIPWFIVDPYKQSGKQIVATPLTPAGAFPIASSEPLTDSHGDYFGDSRLPRDDPKRRHITFFRRFTQHRFSSKSDFDFTIPGLTLRRAWLYSLLMFALLMLLTFAARSTTAATILVAFIGIPWSITMWAPFALIAAEVRKRDALRASTSRPLPQELSPGDTATTTSADPQPPSEVTETGLILGIHNVAVSAPQVVATLISAGIFQALEKPRGQAGDGSVAWVLRFGGVLALVAAGLTLRVADEEPLDERDGGGQV